jgi:hypothetical protein
MHGLPFGITADGAQGHGGYFRFSGNSFNAFEVSDGTNDLFNINTDLLRYAGEMARIGAATPTISTQLVWELGADAAGTFKWANDATTALKRLGSGVMGFTGAIATAQSATAPVLATSGTIATAATGVSRVAPAGAVTGIILAAGTQAGQLVTVINESAAANTITFAASGTSHVAGGTGVVIAGLAKLILVWDSATSLWY